MEEPGRSLAAYLSSQRDYRGIGTVGDKLAKQHLDFGILPFHPNFNMTPEISTRVHLIFHVPPLRPLFTFFFFFKYTYTLTSNIRVDRANAVSSFSRFPSLKKKGKQQETPSAAVDLELCASLKRQQ